jgi:hypothetical protein
MNKELISHVAGSLVALLQAYKIVVYISIYPVDKSVCNMATETSEAKIGGGSRI